jgi:hypothetical protein
LTFDQRRDAIDVPPHAEAVVRGPDGDTYAFGTVEGGTYRVYFPGLARFDFQPPAARVRVTVTHSADDDLVVDLFRTTVQPLALQVVGFEVLHASAVLRRDKVFAFCGVSGTGKSTIAYGLSQRSCTLWGDDALVFDADGPSGVRCFQLPYVAQLREPTRNFFAVTEDAPTVGDEGIPDSPRALAVITVLERCADGRHEIRRLDSAKALEAILPHGYRFTLTDRPRTRRTVESYLDLVARVPVLLGRFTPGFERLPAFLDELERSLPEFGA